MKTETAIRKDIVEVCKRIHAKGWISSTDGNVSVRLPRNRILITPTGIHKGFMNERDLIIIDMAGKLVSGKLKPSSEVALHLECYNERPDINAVVHAHPTMSVAFSLAGIKLAKCMLPEVVFTLGSIPTADYAPPASSEAPKSIQKYIKDFDAIILERHGSVTVGGDVFLAYNTLERMEHVAEITYHARQLGNITPLSQQQIEQLQAIGDAKGWPKRKLLHDNCNDCNACGKHSPERSCFGSGAPEPIETPATNNSLTATIAEEILLELKRVS